MLTSSPIQISNSQRFAAQILCGAEHTVFSFSPSHNPRGWSTEWRTSLPSCRVPVAKNAGASRRSMAAISVPGTVLPDKGPGGLAAPPIRAASAALRPRRVQPLKAAGRNASGRLGRGLPGVGSRTSPAGAASRSAIETSRDDAPG
jgi:hypothetical protein